MSPFLPWLEVKDFDQLRFVPFTLYVPSIDAFPTSLPPHPLSGPGTARLVRRPDSALDVTITYGLMRAGESSTCGNTWVCQSDRDHDLNRFGPFYVPKWRAAPDGAMVADGAPYRAGRGSILLTKRGETFILIEAPLLDGVEIVALASSLHPLTADEWLGSRSA